MDYREIRGRVEYSIFCQSAQNLETSALLDEINSHYKSVPLKQRFLVLLGLKGIPARIIAYEDELATRLRFDDLPWVL